MSEQDWPQRGTAKSEADSTLLGVAPPRIDSSAESAQRSPVLVRSGTSLPEVEPGLLPRVAVPPEVEPGLPPEVEPGLLPRVAVPSRPPHGSAAEAADAGGWRGALEAARRYGGARPVIGMVVVPVLCALALIALTRHAGPHARGAVAPRLVDTQPSVGVAPSALSPSRLPQAAAPDAIADLERRPPGSLHARELVTLAEAHASQKRAAAAALREKLEREPSLAKDPATASQLLTLSADPSTAPEALSALAELGPLGADLLYEVWTGTTQRTDATELARALLYSPDLRPKASPALAVALDLRVAESCEQYQAALPSALADGDRRSVHLLTKLNAKRGCGPKKSADCYPCLRAKSDELTATINAVKSRRPPSIATQ